jgi:hypothetical protein
VVGSPATQQPTSPADGHNPGVKPSAHPEPVGFNIAVHSLPLSLKQDSDAANVPAKGIGVPHPASAEAPPPPPSFEVPPPASFDSELALCELPEPAVFELPELPVFDPDSDSDPPPVVLLEHAIEAIAMSPNKKAGVEEPRCRRMVPERSRRMVMARVLSKWSRRAGRTRAPVSSARAIETRGARGVEDAAKQPQAVPRLRHISRCDTW